jgi:hypothetical protein
MVVRRYGFGLTGELPWPSVTLNSFRTVAEARQYRCIACNDDECRGESDCRMPKPAKLTNYAVFRLA